VAIGTLAMGLPVWIGDGDVVAAATAAGSTAAGETGLSPMRRIRPMQRARTLSAGAQRFTGILRAH
jgi:hypothetical protein